MGSIPLFSFVFFFSSEFGGPGALPNPNGYGSGKFARRLNKNSSEWAAAVDCEATGLSLDALFGNFAALQIACGITRGFSNHCDTSRNPPFCEQTASLSPFCITDSIPFPALNSRVLLESRELQKWRRHLATVGRSHEST